MADTTVSSTEFQSHPGVYMDAGRKPVFITKYRRPVKVLLDIEEYNRLQTLATYRPTRKAMLAQDLPVEYIELLENLDLSHIDPKLDELMEE